MALLAVTVNTLLGQYFEKYYALANGLVEAYGALGIIVFPPLTQMLLDTYGWRNTVLLLGAVYSHTLISGILFQPPSYEQSFSLVATNDDLDDDSCLETNASENDIFTWIDQPSAGSEHSERELDILHFTGLHLFKNVSFLANCTASLSASCAFTGWVIYFVPHCLTKGLTPQEASLLASIAGFAYLVGCLVYIPFVSKQIISARGYLHIVCYSINFSYC